MGKDLGMLIGRRGETLDAIQHLNQLRRQSKLRRTGSHQCGCGELSGETRRFPSTVTRGKSAAGSKTAAAYHLEPMNAYERHVVHAALQDVDNITTYSTGTEPNRRVIIEYVR